MLNDMVAELLLEWQSFQQRLECRLVSCVDANWDSVLLRLALTARHRFECAGSGSTQVVVHRRFIGMLLPLQQDLQQQRIDNGMLNLDIRNASRCVEQIVARIAWLRRCRIAMMASSGALQWFMRLLQVLKHDPWQHGIGDGIETQG